MLQACFSLGADPSHQLRGGHYVGDEVHSLPSPDHRGVEVSFFRCFRKSWYFGIQRGLKIVLAAIPPL